MSIFPSNGFDLLALLVLGFCVFTSLWRGAMLELFGLLGWIAAFLVARLYAAPIANAFFLGLEPAFLRTAVAWASIFVICLLIANLLGSFFKNLFSKVGLSPLDRLLGAVFGAAKAFVVLLALVWLGGYTPLSKSKLFVDSWAVKLCQQVIDTVRQRNAFGAPETTATEAPAANTAATGSSTAVMQAASKPQPRAGGEPSLKLPANVSNKAANTGKTSP